MVWRATILTLFPEMFPGPLGVSLAGKGLANGAWSLAAVDVRAHATDKHRSVDDTPAGGGPGMVMRADVLARAIDAAAAQLIIREAGGLVQFGHDASNPLAHPLDLPPHGPVLAALTEQGLADVATLPVV